jgi:uncharacterized lipoprotein
MLRYLIVGLLAIILLSACAAQITYQQVTGEGQSMLITVYRSPT